MMNKRAIELQFHWIFVMIAGAVIIAFFFSVAQKQQSLSEQKLSVTLASHMDAIFTGAIASTGTAQPLVTPQPGIAFSCTKFCECSFTVGDHATPFGDNILFAPALIRDQDATAWAAEWKLPFRITNVLLLTNPRIKYYLVYESDHADSNRLYQKVSTLLPHGLNLETVNSLAYAYDVLPQGDDHTRFIFLATPQPNLGSLNPQFAGQDMSAVWLRSETEAVFYQKSADVLEFNAREAPIAGDALLQGALIAADRDLYFCMVKKAFEKMQLVARVHAKRAQTLKDQIGSERADCVYEVQLLDDVAQKAAMLARDLTARNALGVILAAQHELRRMNDNLIGHCPELY